MLTGYLCRSKRDLAVVWSLLRFERRVLDLVHRRKQYPNMCCSSSLALPVLDKKEMEIED